MSINRYNYEEFFLLYADGELCPLETEMVEQFVRLQPDLKDELDILMDCKLVADMPVFFPKEKLYKQTIWDTENINQSQTKLLLLLDNELNENEKETLKKEIDENTVLQQEWNLLQQAKFPVETITHPYKKPLYREKKILVIPWLRLAAAASIIGAGLFLVGKNIGENKTVETSAVSKKPGIALQKNQIDIAQTHRTEKAVEYNDGYNTEAGVENTKAAAKNTVQNKIVRVEKWDQSLKNTITTTAHIENPEENTSVHLTDNLAINNSRLVDENDNRTAFITNKAIDNSENTSNLKLAVAKLKISPTIAQLTSLTTAEETQILVDMPLDENEYIRIAGARVKKQKIRGVFRGVFRGLGRTFSNSKVEAAPAFAINNE